MKTDRPHKLFTSEFAESKLAAAVELNRPSRGWMERLFRISLYNFLAFGLLNILRLTKYHEEFERRLGNFGQVLGIIFLVTLFYMLNYMVLHFTKSRIIKYIWFAAIGLLTVMVILNVIMKRA